jgi:hypothetical protein
MATWNINFHHRRIDTEPISGSSDDQTRFAFCVNKDMSPATMFGASIVFYSFWGLLLIFVSHPHIWRVVRKAPYRLIAALPKKSNKSPENLLKDAPPAVLQPSTDPMPIPPAVECRGRLYLDFSITVRMSCVNMFSVHVHECHPMFL